MIYKSPGKSTQQSWKAWASVSAHEATFLCMKTSHICKLVFKKSKLGRLVPRHVITLKYHFSQFSSKKKPKGTSQQADLRRNTLVQQKSPLQGDSNIQKQPVLVSQTPFVKHYHSEQFHKYIIYTREDNQVQDSQTDISVTDLQYIKKAVFAEKSEIFL